MNDENLVNPNSAEFQLDGRAELARTAPKGAFASEHIGDFAGGHRSLQPKLIAEDTSCGGVFVKGGRSTKSTTGAFVRWALRERRLTG
jgi:hypothetical protein